MPPPRTEEEEALEDEKIKEIDPDVKNPILEIAEQANLTPA